MNRSIIGIIIFCVFLGSNAASGNVSFSDSILISGAKCIISMAIDSNSFFSSNKHPCNKYYFFQINSRHSGYSASIMIDFSSSVKCTLFIRQASYWSFGSNKTDTLPIPCDSLKNIPSNYYSPMVVTTKINADWIYLAPVKRLASAISLSGNLLHFVLKSASDSNDVYLSRTILHFQHVNTPQSTVINNSKFIGKTYTINGEVIQSKRRLPSVYILKDNSTTKSMVHLNKF